MFALLFALACTDKVPNVDDSGPGGLRTLDTCTTERASGLSAFFDLVMCAEIQDDGDEIVVLTNGLPPHTSPYYEEDDPNWVAWDDQGGQRFQNPNRIAEQALTIRIPASPVSRGLNITTAMVDREAGNDTNEYREPGISLDGVALFSGIAAPGDDIAQEAETFDIWEAHPQNTGVYHHHSPNPAALAVLQHHDLTDTTTPGEGEIEIFGIMCDGTVVLGCREADGAEVSGSLDAQGGHVTDITGPDGELWFSDRYHTHSCEGVYETFTPEIQYYEGCARG